MRLAVPPIVVAITSSLGGARPSHISKTPTAFATMLQIFPLLNQYLSKDERNAL